MKNGVKTIQAAAYNGVRTVFETFLAARNLKYADISSEGFIFLFETNNLIVILQKV